MELVQVSKRSGRIDRVAEGEIPVIELDLEPHQRVVQAELVPVRYDRRKTTDWFWTVYIESRLGVPEPSTEQAAYASLMANGPERALVSA